jgi:hypothetical protein
MQLPDTGQLDQRADGVAAARPVNQRAGGGAISTPALHSLLVRPIPQVMVRELLVREHYLHSFPGGTHLAFGVYCGKRLMGALTMGAGPAQAYALVAGAEPDDCMTLTRLWLSDDLPKNSESACIGVVLRALKHNTNLKFLVSYADPTQGHRGVIYQATNWLYTGLSQGTPLYNLGDGRLYHSRTLSQICGTHSVKYLLRQGVDVNLVPQQGKHRYVYFMECSWRHRLKVPILPYPKAFNSSEDHQEAPIDYR